MLKITLNKNIARTSYYFFVYLNIAKEFIKVATTILQVIKIKKIKEEIEKY